MFLVATAVASDLRFEVARFRSLCVCVFSVSVSVCVRVCVCVSLCVSLCVCVSGRFQGVPEACADLHVNFGEAWRTLGNPQRSIHENLPRSSLSSGEGPPYSLGGPTWGLFLSTGFWARFLQPFPKSLVTVKYYSTPNWPLIAVNGR